MRVGGNIQCASGEIESAAVLHSRGGCVESERPRSERTYPTPFRVVPFSDRSDTKCRSSCPNTECHRSTDTERWPPAGEWCTEAWSDRRGRPAGRDFRLVDRVNTADLPNLRWEH